MNKTANVPSFSINHSVVFINTSCIYINKTYICIYTTYIYRLCTDEIYFIPT